LEKVKNERIRLKLIRKEKSGQKKMLASRKSISSSLITLPLTALFQSVSNQDEKIDMLVLSTLRTMIETISSFDDTIMSLRSKNAMHDSVDNLLKMNEEEDKKSEDSNGNKIKRIDSILFSLFSSGSASPDSYESILMSHTQGIVGLFCYICSFLLFVSLFFFTYALLAVVYVSHWLRIDFYNSPRL
jgi:hypothetical protein